MEMMEIKWPNWKPVDRATLCFVVRGGEILLILKKRGLGAGKVNGPGGRIEPGESAVDAAIRETREELQVTPLSPELRGELLFQFADGYSLHCGVFLSPDCVGEARETEEAVPLWTPLESIPYERMWEDDKHWLPGLIMGKKFRASFYFDGEKMLWKKIEWNPTSFYLVESKNS